MKTIKRFSLAILILFFLSCSSNDSDSSDSTAVKIIGTWKLTSSKVNGELETLDACDFKETIVITKTKFSLKEYLGVNCEESDILGPVDYNLSGNTVMYTFEGVSYVEGVVVTATTLSITDNEDPDYIYEYVFTRQ